MSEIAEDITEAPRFKVGRKPLGKSKTVSITLAITENELRSIKRWKSQNLTNSTSEAIRRLCQIAIAVTSSVPVHPGTASHSPVEREGEDA